MADPPLATEEMRRQLRLNADRQYGINPGADNERGYAFNQWLPVSTNRLGSASWVQEGAKPQWAVPEALQGGLLGVAGMADAPRTGKLTPEALTSLLAGSAGAGGLLAPEGALAAGAARLVPAIKVGDRVLKGETHLKTAMRLPQNTPAEIAARKEAIMYGENSRGFVDHRGRFLNREQAQQYALMNDLIRDDAPAYARTHPELISEWLKKPDEVMAGVAVPGPVVPRISAGLLSDRQSEVPIKDRVY